MPRSKKLTREEVWDFLMRQHREVCRQKARRPYYSHSYLVDFQWVPLMVSAMPLDHLKRNQ